MCTLDIGPDPKPLPPGNAKRRQKPPATVPTSPEPPTPPTP